MSKTNASPPIAQPVIEDIETQEEKHIESERRSHSATSIEVHSGVEEFDDDERSTPGEGKCNEQRVINAVQCIMSKHSIAISNHIPGPPPDGGTKAWLQGRELPHSRSQKKKNFPRLRKSDINLTVVQGHLCLINVMGYSSSYGLFEAYYLSPTSRFPTLTSSTWAWPGSTQLCLTLILATISGRLFDAGYYRPTIIFGLSMQIIGAFTASASKTYAQIFLSQGICHGIGCGFVLCPTISLLSTYFSKRRSMAIALVAGGSGTGGVIFPLIAQHLLTKIGFAWTVRIMGFVMLANAAVILSLGRTRIPGRKSGPWLELAAFKEPPYVLFICGMFSTFLGLYFVFTYVSSFLAPSDI